MAQVVRQLIQLATMAVLARLLLAGDFGLAGIAMVIVAFVALIRDLGSASAIIQRREVGDGLLSTLFWSNITFGIVAAAILVVASPWISGVFSEPRLTDIIRALSIAFVLGAIGVVPQALVERRLAFDLVARNEIAAALVGSVSSIWAAAAGLGVWSLVIQAISTSAVTSLLYLGSSGFRPTLSWNSEEFTGVVGFSLGIAGFNVFNFLARNADNLIIGRFLGPTPLGYYALAYRLMLYPLQMVSSLLGRVFYPVYARIQDDDAEIRRIYLRTMSLIGCVAFPFVFGIGVTATRSVAVVLGPNWAPTASVLQILAPVALIQVVVTTVGPIYQAKGRSDLLFAWGALTAVIVVSAFFLGLSDGILGVARAYLAATVVLMIPGLLVPYRLIGLSLASVGGVLWRPLLAALAMAIGVRICDAVIGGPDDDVVRLMAIVVTGFSLYLLASVAVNRRGLADLVTQVTGTVRR